MRAMFANSPNATPDVSQWNISKATNMFSIFEDSGITRENYEKALIRFAEHNDDPNNEGLTLPQNIDLNSVPVTFCSDAAAQAKVILEANGWSNIGNQGAGCP